MARAHADHDIDDDIVCRANSLLDLLRPRSKPVKDVEDISVEHFVLLYHHVTGEAIPGSASISSKRNGAKVVQFIVDSLADDVFGIPMDHMTGAGIVTGNRRMLADLLEIFSSIMLLEQANDVNTHGNLNETNSLDALSTPMREVLLSLQNDVEFLAKSAMHRAPIHKAKDVYTQTTPISVTSAITSPILWNEVLARTSQRSGFGVKQQTPKQAKPMSRNTSKYLTQSYRPGKKVLTPKHVNPMSKSTGFLTRRTVHGNTRPGARCSGVSRTTSTTSPEVQSGLRRQTEQVRGSVAPIKPKELGKEGWAPSQIPIQGLINLVSSSVYLTSLLDHTHSPHAQQRRTILDMDDNNNLQLTDLRQSRTVRPSVSESHKSMPQYQRPMKKVIKPKPVISSKIRRKSSTGSVSLTHHETYMSSMKVGDHWNKDPVCYKENMMKLTDQIQSLRERRKEISKQMTQLQQENKSLQKLEDLIIKEIRLSKSIEKRRRQSRCIPVL